MPRDDTIDTISPETTALLAIDVQKAFADASSPLANAGVDLSDAIQGVPNVKELLDICRDIELTVVFTRSVRRSDGSDAPQNVYDIVPEVLNGSQPLCCQDSDNVNYVDGIEPRKDEYEVEKVRYNAFHNTPLEYYLRNEGIETVLACGFTTNVCVEGTLRGAHERGFNVVLVKDCCASFSEKQHRSGVRNVELLLGGSTNLEQVREMLNH